MRNLAAPLLLLAVILAGRGTEFGEEKKPDDPRLRRALERSLLFPGLGQLSEKQYVKAALFTSAEVACLATIVVNARRGNAAYRHYRATATVDDAVKWRQETERLDRRRNAAIAAAAGIWVLNMVDIFIHVKSKYGRGKSVAFHPFYHHESQTYGAGVNCSF